MKGSVYDKIRADFNSSKKDRYVFFGGMADARCAQLRSCDSEGEELEMWQDILGKIKEGVLQSFDSRVLHYEEDIRKMDSQRTLPGWNYCTFFILKEGLAQSFEHMLLLEDALIQYDELEASFFQMLKGMAMKYNLSSKTNNLRGSREPEEPPLVMTAQMYSTSHTRITAF